MAISRFAAAPFDIDNNELSQVALSSVIALGGKLAAAFNILDNAETLVLSAGDVQDHNGCYTCISLMKLETRDAIAATLFVTIVSEYQIAPDKLGAYIASLRTALMSLSLDYRAWVIMRVRYILVDLDDTSTLNSGSSTQSPDTIRISGHPTAHGIAEMIIHEASHLHYNATIQGDAITQKGAPEVYSVFMRCNRPLERVVFAYHAARNIACMQGQTLQHDHEIQAHKDAAALGQTIADNERFLTSYGHRLIESLP